MSVLKGNREAKDAESRGGGSERWWRGVSGGGVTGRGEGSVVETVLWKDRGAT